MNIVPEPHACQRRLFVAFALGAWAPNTLELVRELEPSGEPLYHPLAGVCSFMGGHACSLNTHTHTEPDTHSYVYAQFNTEHSMLPVCEYQPAPAHAPVRSYTTSTEHVHMSHKHTRTPPSHFCVMRSLLTSRLPYEPQLPCLL